MSSLQDNPDFQNSLHRGLGPCQKVLMLISFIMLTVATSSLEGKNFFPLVNILSGFLLFLSGCMSCRSYRKLEYDEDDK